METEIFETVDSWVVLPRGRFRKQTRWIKQLRRERKRKRMKKTLMAYASVFLVFGVLLMSPTVYGFAEGRPIERLPEDVAHWTRVGTTIPRHVIEVNAEQGPLAALTWGPAKGMAALARSMAGQVWNVVKPDQWETDAAGVRLGYEF